MRAAPLSESGESLAAAYIVASVHSRSSDFSATAYWGRLINRLHHHWVTKAALIMASIVHTVIVLGECRSHVVLNNGDREDSWIVNVGSGAAAQQCKRALNVRGHGAAKRALFTWDMSPSYGIMIELLCIAVYIIDISLAYGSHIGGCRRTMQSLDAARDRSARFAEQDEEEQGEQAEPTGRCSAVSERARLSGGCGFTHIRLSLVLLLTLDLLVHLASGFHSVRFARALRPLVAAFRLRHVRSLLATLLRAWRLASIFLTLIAIEACVFGFALVVLLCGDDFVSGGNDDDGEGVVATGFASQIYQLFLLATSPPEMLTIMQEQTSFATRALCASMLTLFQLGGKLFLYKLVIAASMRHFREEQTKTVGVQIYNRRVAHERAFAALTLTLPAARADVAAALDASVSQLRRGLIAGAEDGGASPRGGALVVPAAADPVAAGASALGAPDADALGPRGVEGAEDRGVGARAWVNVFRRVRTSEMSFSWLWLSLPLSLNRLAQRLALPAGARRCANIVFGGAERTLDMWRDVAVSAFESVVGADDVDDGGADNTLPAVPSDASTEDRLQALERTEIGASRDQFRRLCVLVDADIWLNVEHRSSHCAAAKGRVARFFDSPLGTIAVSVAIIASLVQVYLDATTGRGSAGFYVWTLVGLALLVLFSLESAAKMWAWGVRRFFADTLNHVELFVVFASACHYAVLTVPVDVLSGGTFGPDGYATQTSGLSNFTGPHGGGGVHSDTAARAEVQTVALRFLQAAFCARILRLLRLLQVRRVERDRLVVLGCRRCAMRCRALPIPLDPT